MATTTTTTTTTTTNPFGVSLDRAYVHTLFGKLNILILVLNIICFICAVSQIYIPSQGWFYFVCVTGFWTGLIELLLGLCSIQYHTVRIVQWKLGVLIFYGLWSFFYFSAASAVTYYATNFLNTQGWYAGTFFGYAATIAYGYAAYIRFQDWKTSGSPTTATLPA